jgi:simple sugar transport system ATP-binding protein
VTALDGVDVDVYPHEILAVMGDNGAGKSTLVRMLSGLESPDGGTLLLHGEPVSFSGIKDANRAGVATIFQKPAMCSAMNVSDNVFMGKEHVSRVFIDRKKMALDTQAILRRIGSPLSPSRMVRGLSEGERKTLSFAQAMLRDPEILILDEPTASLSVIQAGEVLNQLLKMREMGKSLVVVCHDLSEVFAISDRICVMRHGEVSAILDTRETSYESVVGYMAGVRQDS